MNDDNSKYPPKIKPPIFNKILSSDALLIATIPVIAYLFLFAYDYGYFSYYNLPSYFMDFNLANIIIMSGMFFLLLFLLFYINGIISELFGFIPKPIRKILWNAAQIAVLLFALRFFIGEKNSNWINPIPLWVIVGLYIIFSLLLPLFFVKEKVTYFQKLKLYERVGQENRDRESDNHKTDTLLWKIAYRVPELILISFMLFVTYNAGNFIASTKVHYRVVNTDSERVVIWSTNTYAVCAPFNRQNNEITQSFIVLRFGEDPDIEYTYEYLGRLKMAPLNNPDNSATP